MSFWQRYKQAWCWLTLGHGLRVVWKTIGEIARLSLFVIVALCLILASPLIAWWGAFHPTKLVAVIKRIQEKAAGVN